MVSIVLLSLTLLNSLLCLLPLLRIKHWVIRSLDFPRLQIAVMLAFLLACDLFLLDLESPPVLMSMLFALGCLIHQLWWIVPYTHLVSSEVKWATGTDSHNTISIISANVLMTNRKADSLLAQIRQLEPDFVLTLESDGWWEKELAVLHSEYPYRMGVPLDNLYGMHLYSRLEFLRNEVRYLLEDDVPSFHLEVEMPSGQAVRIHCLHPAPPSPTENETSSERDAELLMMAREVRDLDTPVIVVGDLNDVAWSKTTRVFRKVSGLLDPRVGRGVFNTFHARYPFLRWPLDHLFHSTDFSLKAIKRLEYIHSDHFPLYTQLQITQTKEQSSNLSDSRQAEQFAQVKTPDIGFEQGKTS